MFLTKEATKIINRDMKNFNKEQYLKYLEDIKKLDSIIVQYNSGNNMYNAFNATFLEIIDKMHLTKLYQNQRGN